MLGASWQGHSARRVVKGAYGHTESAVQPIVRLTLVGILLMLLTGCASIRSLPQTVSDVDFSSDIEGKTGWSRYEQVYTFREKEVASVYEAAKAGLADAGFALRKGSLSQGVVFGEHGITLHDWNVVVGIYLKPVAPGVKAKIIVQGSKDTGFSGDVTGDNWSGKIIKGMRGYLRERRLEKESSPVRPSEKGTTTCP